ncbi:hypothetical protein BDZ97DRAFT_1768584 [Flammula alnicola]|nr:hypothetical protein BDZ97DRAFT_1768584 [Flammula alnicola]
MAKTGYHIWHKEESAYQPEAGANSSFSAFSIDLDNVRRRSEISAPKVCYSVFSTGRDFGTLEGDGTSIPKFSVTSKTQTLADLKSANVAQAALGRNQLLPLGVQILADAARSLRTIADMYRLLQSRYSLGLSAQYSVVVTDILILFEEVFELRADEKNNRQHDAWLGKETAQMKRKERTLRITLPHPKYSQAAPSLWNAQHNPVLLWT